MHVAMQERMVEMTFSPSLKYKAINSKKQKYKVEMQGFMEMLEDGKSR